MMAMRLRLWIIIPAFSFLILAKCGMFKKESKTSTLNSDDEFQTAIREFEENMPFYDDFFEEKLYFLKDSTQINPMLNKRLIKPNNRDYIEKYLRVYKNFFSPMDKGIDPNYFILNADKINDSIYYLICGVEYFKQKKEIYLFSYNFNRSFLPIDRIVLYSYMMNESQVESIIKPDSTILTTHIYSDFRYRNDSLCYAKIYPMPGYLAFNKYKINKYGFIENLEVIFSNIGLLANKDAHFSPNDSIRFSSTVVWKKFSDGKFVKSIGDMNVDFSKFYFIRSKMEIVSKK